MSGIALTEQCVYYKLMIIEKDLIMLDYSNNTYI